MADSPLYRSPGPACRLAACQGSPYAESPLLPGWRPPDWEPTAAPAWQASWSTDASAGLQLSPEGTHRSLGPPPCFEEEIERFLRSLDVGSSCQSSVAAGDPARSDDTPGPQRCRRSKSPPIMCRSERLNPADALERLPEEAFAAVPAPLLSCGRCGRRFSATRLEVHEAICFSTTSTVKRGVFESQRQRLLGLAFAGPPEAGSKPSGRPPPSEGKMLQRPASTKAPRKRSRVPSRTEPGALRKETTELCTPQRRPRRSGVSSTPAQRPRRTSRSAVNTPDKEVPPSPRTASTATRRREAGPTATRKRAPPRVSETSDAKEPPSPSAVETGTSPTEADPTAAGKRASPRSPEACDAKVASPPFTDAKLAAAAVHHGEHGDQVQALEAEAAASQAGGASQKDDEMDLHLAAVRWERLARSLCFAEELRRLEQLGASTDSSDSGELEEAMAKSSPSAPLASTSLSWSNLARGLDFAEEAALEPSPKKDLAQGAPHATELPPFPIISSPQEEELAHSLFSTWVQTSSSCQVPPIVAEAAQLCAEVDALLGDDRGHPPQSPSSGAQAWEKEPLRMPAALQVPEQDFERPRYDPRKYYELPPQPGQSPPREPKDLPSTELGDWLKRCADRIRQRQETRRWSMTEEGASEAPCA
ncbi:unnamed protein product [Symbiodinium natans]|uniref:Uncharacterized protein n=1 Tax=Symbiodinium natans TaxID=878477 RepID=A0A812P7W9_9DINO|nr:unnamed protein product [Symbiodinium natans]